jgi:MFS family permease
VISDVWKPEERGKALSLYLLAPVLGPVVGPLAGAWIAQGSNWRWIFWGSTIVGAAVQVIGILLLDESVSHIAKAGLQFVLIRHSICTRSART